MAQEKAQRAADAMNALLANSGETLMQAADIAAKTKSQLKAKQTSGVQQFLSKFATIFTPLIPGFIAAGLLLGIATLIGTVMHLPADAQGMLADALNLMKVFSKGLFTFLVILIGYNAAQAFGGTGVNGAIIASLFLLGYNPAATTGYFSGIQDFFGLPIDPRGNIIGVLIAAWASARIECIIRRFMPDDLDMLLTSMLTLLVTAALAYLIIMPLGGWLFEGMSWLFMHLNSNPLGCAVLAGLFLVSVVFGVHQGFIPVYLALMSSQGFNSLFPHSFNGRRRTGWRSAGALLAGRKTQRVTQSGARGDYSRASGCGRTANLWRYAAAHEAVYHRLSRRRCRWAFHRPGGLVRFTDGVKQRLWPIRFGCAAVDDLRAGYFARHGGLCRRNGDLLSWRFYFYRSVWLPQCESGLRS
ncbi:PTS system N-acetylmuramic acid transporter subunits EIIBC [Salmonella enterica subsp. arizonae]|nr:PTS system N-acetylmuramic acid transporter subunits EIIBC [Salmonella enterica subsp. arizonae]